MAPLSALAYHDRTTHTPASVRASTGLDYENQPRSNLAYRNLPTRSLPKPTDPELPALEAITDEGSLPGVATETAIDRTMLAQLCYHAAGITKRITRGNRTIPFRAAACTGALYHVDLYPVVGPGTDIAPGVYHYDPPNHRLDVLREGDHRGVVYEATHLESIREAPLTIVATSTWWRNAWKYRERTFRHAFWDSGTVLANLAATALATGHPATVALSFADHAFVDLLGLDPTTIAPLEVVAIGRDAPTAPAPTLDEIDPEFEPLSQRPIEYERIYEAWAAGVCSSGDAAHDWREHALQSTPVGTASPGSGERYAWQAVDDKRASARPLGSTIRRRGSCRAFSHDSISLAQLSTILDRSLRGLPLDVRMPDQSPLVFTDLYAIVHAVDDLPAGTYQVLPETHEFELLQEGSFRREAGHLALDQPLAHDAAVCLYFMADIEAIVETLGDRGYRAAQFEAAMTAGRLYLATYAHRELGGTGLTFYDDVVTSFFTPRTEKQTPMFLYVLGVPS